MIDLTPPRCSRLRRAWHRLNNSVLGDIVGGIALFLMLAVILVLGG